jgi:hypothetical protein
MNLWYTVADHVSVDEFGDPIENFTCYDFEQFETKELAQKNIPRIRGKLKAKPIIATVEWPDAFWDKFYAEKKPIEAVKVSKWYRKIEF